jgi:hypothetical protein
MTLDDVILLEKHRDLIKDRSQVIFAEGVTNASKSFIIGIAFILRIMTTPDSHTQFVLAGESIPVLERMYIQNESSFYNIFNGFCTYNKGGEGGAKITVKTGKGKKDKKIYLVGYDNKKRWKGILGMTIHGFNVEEANIADDEFISESFIRVFRNGGFMYASSNGGDPDTLLYTDYMNKGRPLTKWEEQIPKETWEELEREAPDPTFRYYFFNFDDNPTMTQEERQKLIDNTPKNSYQWKTKIIGIRGVREGVIYADYMTREKNIIHLDMLSDNNEDLAFLNKHGIELMTIGQDVGGTDNNAFIIKVFTSNYKHVIDVDLLEFSNVDFDTIWEEFIKWFMPYWERYSMYFKGDFIDSAAKIMRLSMDKRLKAHLGLRCYKAYKYTIIDRCDYGIRILDQGRKLFTQRTEKVYESFTKAFVDNSSKTDIRGFNLHLHKDRVDASEYGEANYIAKMVGYLKVVTNE